VDVLAENAYSNEHDDCDGCDEQPVFDDVLPGLIADEVRQVLHRSILLRPKPGCTGHQVPIVVMRPASPEPVHRCCGQNSQADQEHAHPTASCGTPERTDSRRPAPLGCLVENLIREPLTALQGNCEGTVEKRLRTARQASCAPELYWLPTC